MLDPVVKLGLPCLANKILSKIRDIWDEISERTKNGPTTLQVNLRPSLNFICQCPPLQCFSIERCRCQVCQGTTTVFAQKDVADTKHVTVVSKTHLLAR